MDLFANTFVTIYLLIAAAFFCLTTLELSAKKRLNTLRTGQAMSTSILWPFTTAYVQSLIPVKQPPRR